MNLANSQGKTALLLLSISLRPLSALRGLILVTLLSFAAQGFSDEGLSRCRYLLPGPALTDTSAAALARLKLDDSFVLKEKIFRVLEIFSGGNSAHTYKVSDGSQEFVLKVPKGPGPVPISMLNKEYESINILAEWGVSVPEIYGYKPGEYLLKSFEKGEVLSKALRFDQSLELSFEMLELRRLFIQKNVVVFDLRSPNLLLDPQGKLLVLDPGPTLARRNSRFDELDPFRALKDQVIRTAVERFSRHFFDSPEITDSPVVRRIMSRYIKQLKVDQVWSHNILKAAPPNLAEPKGIEFQKLIRSQIEERLQPSELERMINAAFETDFLPADTSERLKNFLRLDLKAQRVHSVVYDFMVEQGGDIDWLISAIKALRFQLEYEIDSPDILEQQIHFRLDPIRWRNDPKIEQVDAELRYLGELLHDRSALQARFGEKTGDATYYEIIDWFKMRRRH